MKFSTTIGYIFSRTIYHSVPIYNFNWINSRSFYKRLLGDLTITVIDVGARSGSAEELGPLSEHINYIGFDADADEVARLSLEPSIYKMSRFFNAFIGRKEEVVSFDLHHSPGNSSVYKFGDEYKKWFISDPSDPIKQTFEINSTSLDNVISEEVDFIKLDTQGNEFEIILGAPSSVGSALMVESEVEFVEMYSGQKLAHDVMSLMSKNGFEILYLNRVFINSARFKGRSRGQLIFGDALFGISRNRALKLSIERQLKYCALLINYGLPDFAFDIYSQNPEISDRYPELGRYFDRAKKSRSKLVLLAISVVDKLLFLLMAARKTNGLRYDSDRSWPVR